MKKKVEINYPIEQLEQTLGANWINLRKARQKTYGINLQLNEKLSSFSPEDTSTVVFGSLARNEFTEGSDIDWTLLIDGRANSQHLDAKLTPAVNSGHQLPHAAILFP